MKKTFNWWWVIVAIALVATSVKLYTGRHAFYTLPAFAEAPAFYILTTVACMGLLLGCLWLVRRHES